MHIRYDDITNEIDKPPVWWLNGVPRYRDFRPDDLNIYAQEAALLRVECQVCFKQFDIGQYGPASPSHARNVPYHDDPPSHSSDSEEYCGGGAMGFVLLRVLEFWKKASPGESGSHAYLSWFRDHENEIICEYPTLYDQESIPDRRELDSSLERELSMITDLSLRQEVRLLLGEPVLTRCEWEYGVPGETFPCWKIAESPTKRVGIFYCEMGFGPKNPWGLVMLGAPIPAMGQDSAWFPTFREAAADILDLPPASLNA